MRIAILCADKLSEYYNVKVQGVTLDIYTQERDMLNFNFDAPVIAHPPCAQWSRLRTFAKHDSEVKALAFLCKLAVDKCGGIVEHPHGSLFMRKHIGYGKCISVNQHWFGFRAKKSTLLYCNKVTLLSHPLSFDLPTCNNISHANKCVRSRSTLEFNTWLVESVYNSLKLKA